MFFKNTVGTISKWIMDTIGISVNVNEFVFRRSLFNLNYRKKIFVEDFKLISVYLKK